MGLPGEAYAKGDLGFDPENIQLDYEIGETIEKMHSLSVKSALAVLKEIELMTSKVAEVNIQPVIFAIKFSIIFYYYYLFFL